MKLQRKESVAGFLFTVPFLVGFCLFFLFPFGLSLWYTVTSGVGAVRFVGFENYLSVIQSKAFRLAAGNTFRFMGVGVPLIMGLSFLLSLALCRQFRGAHFVRSALLYPMIVPIASTVMFFQVMFADQGIVNHLFSVLNLPVKSWLSSDRAFWVLVILYVWKNCGYNMVLFLTGLSAIPHEFREVAQLEGANSRQYLLRVTLPLMGPSFFFVFVISVVNSFKSFREAFLLGGKNPHESIYLLQHFMNNNFESLNYQRLSVAAVMTFTLIFIMVIFLFWLKDRYGEEGNIL
ncbi:MAG: carbohydrate ABC transporter permease [Massiliimalia sp.]|jgi:multiple sugar transport system permease protein